MTRDALLRFIPGDRGKQRAALLAEERFWDAVVLGEPIPVDAIDPDLATTIRHISALDDAPLPDAAFAALLEHDLLWSNLPAPPVSAVAAQPTASPDPVTASAPAGRSNMTRQRVLVNLAAMAALLAIVLTSIFVTLRVGPLASRDRTEAPLTLGPGITDETLLLAGRFDGFPDGILSASIDRWVLQPGAEITIGSNVSNSEGPSAYLIESGTLTIQSDSPIAVTRVGTTAPISVAEASQIELEPGDRGFGPSGVTTLWRNTGATPVRILDARIKKRESAPPVEGVLNYTVVSEFPFPRPDHPIAVNVFRLTLQPGAELSASDVPGLEMLNVEAGRLVAVDAGDDGSPLPPIVVGEATRLLGSFLPDRVFRSSNDEPVSLLLVTIGDADLLGRSG
jgi:hypothetical protein